MKIDTFAEVIVKIKSGLLLRQGVQAIVIGSSFPINTDSKSTDLQASVAHLSDIFTHYAHYMLSRFSRLF